MWNTESRDLYTIRYCISAELTPLLNQPSSIPDVEDNRVLHEDGGGFGSPEGTAGLGALMLMFGLGVVWSGTENLAERLCCPGSRPNAEPYLCSTPPLLLIVYGILQDNSYAYITTGRVPSYDPNIGGRHPFYIAGVVLSMRSETNL